MNLSIGTNSGNHNFELAGPTNVVREPVSVAMMAHDLGGVAVAFHRRKANA